MLTLPTTDDEDEEDTLLLEREDSIAKVAKDVWRALVEGRASPSILSKKLNCKEEDKILHNLLHKQILCDLVRLSNHFCEY